MFNEAELTSEEIGRRTCDFEKQHGTEMLLKVAASATNKLLVKKGVFTERELRWALYDELSNHKVEATEEQLLREANRSANAAIGDIAEECKIYAEKAKQAGLGRYCPACKHWLLHPDPTMGPTCGTCQGTIELRPLNELMKHYWELRLLLRDYLARPSLDGRQDRQDMRKQLGALIDAKVS